MCDHYFPSLVVAFTLFLSVVSAADPNPMQDFCIAINGTKDAVYVNGKICKHPKLAVPEDFIISGIGTPGNTSNRLGSRITTFNVNTVPGLNTLGISIARVDFGPYGVNPPHVHPRASEILVVLKGTLYAGFVTSNPDHRLFSGILHPGEAFIFPVGLVHFQRNVGNTSAVAMATFGGQYAGLVTLPNAIFGSNPAISPKVLDRAFQLDNNTVAKLQKKVWFNNG